MRHDHDTLLRLAQNRQRRIVNGRPRFDLTVEDAEASAYAAMRLAEASKSQVESRSSRPCVAA